MAFDDDGRILAAALDHVQDAGAYPTPSPVRSGIAVGMRQLDLEPVELRRRNHGPQCGFCTPGFVVVSVTAFLAEHPKLVVLEAGGREARGNGTAKARVTCRLGRGPLAEVSAALMDRFADNLATELPVNSADLSSPVHVPSPATEA